MKYDAVTAVVALLLSLLTLAAAEDCPEFYSGDSCRHYEPYLGYNSDGGSLNPPPPGIVDPEGPPPTDDEDVDDSDTDGDDIKAAGGSSGIGTAAIVASSVAGAVLLIGALAVRRRVANRNAETAELEANESSGMDTTALSGAAAGMTDVTPVEDMPEEQDVEDELADDDDVESSFDNV